MASKRLGCTRESRKALTQSFMRPSHDAVITLDCKGNTAGIDEKRVQFITNAI